MKTSSCSTLLVLFVLVVSRAAAIPVMTSSFRSYGLKCFIRVTLSSSSSVDSNEFRRLMDEDNRQLGPDRFDFPRKYRALLQLIRAIDCVC